MDNSIVSIILLSQCDLYTDVAKQTNSTGHSKKTLRAKKELEATTPDAGDEHPKSATGSVGTFSSSTTRWGFGHFYGWPAFTTTADRRAWQEFPKMSMLL